MKTIFECVRMVFGAIWILLNDNEQQRQLDYDNGGGEIE